MVVERTTRQSFVAVVIATLVAAGLANAQTCDSLLGKTDCGAKSVQQRGASPLSGSGNDWDFGRSSTSGGLGVDLSSSASSDTAVFGAITFGGGNTICSGPFRSRRC